MSYQQNANCEASIRLKKKGSEDFIRLQGFFLNVICEWENHGNSAKPMKNEAMKKMATPTTNV
jgi:hypothetical protein